MPPNAVMKRPAATLSRKHVLKRPTAANGVEARNSRGRAAGIAKIKAAAKRGTQIINHGAGTMPIDAPAPFGGTRYTILRDPPGGKIRQVAAHSGKRDSDGSLLFDGAPEFRPNLTPEQCLRAGIFGGCYFNPRGGKPGIFASNVAIDHKEFPKKWFKGLREDMYKSRRYYIPTNKYGVKSGQDQAFWESKGWIHEQDPRGWFQWYCRFFQGRRSLDDARQIKRWAACASDRGRWRGQLCGRIQKDRKSYNDPKVAPVIRQTLLHWAYELTKPNWENWKTRA